MLARIREQFHIAEDKPVNEAVMMRRIMASVCVIVLCLTAMGMTAYGYYSHDVSSGVNYLSGAWYDLKITVSGQGQGTQQLERTEEGYQISLTPGSYTVTMEKQGTAQTGFCLVKVGDMEYHTQQLGADVSQPGGQVQQIAFTLELSQPATVFFVPTWGTSHYYYDVTVNPAQEQFYIRDSEVILVFSSV